MTLFEPGGLALHHIAVVVADLDAATGRYAALGFAGAERSVIPEQGVEIVTFPAGPGWVELI
ncbi:MAG: VOC family protein, partial [Chloroflexota bacterium]